MTINLRKNPKLVKGMRIEIEGAIYHVDSCVDLSYFGSKGFRVYLTEVR